MSNDDDQDHLNYGAYAATCRHVYSLAGQSVHLFLFTFHEKEVAEINGSGATFVCICLCVYNTSEPSGDIKGGWQDVDLILFCYLDDSKSFRLSLDVFSEGWCD